MLGHEVRVGVARAHALDAVEPDDELLDAGVDPARVGAHEGRPVDPERGREVGTARGHLAQGRRPGREAPPALDAHDRDPARRHGQVHRVVATAELGDDLRGAERRVTGEGHLVPGREDPHLGGAVVPRGDERRLAEVELPGPGEHLVVRQPGGIREDTQRVAREGFTGDAEDVEQLEGQVHAPSLPERRWSWEGRGPLRRYIDRYGLPRRCRPRQHLPLPARRDRVVALGPAHRARPICRCCPRVRRPPASSPTSCASTASNASSSPRSSAPSARPSSPASGDFEVEPLLREWDYGAYEGITTTQISAEIGHAVGGLRRRGPAGRHPGRERSRRSRPARSRSSTRSGPTSSTATWPSSATVTRCAS